MIGKIEIRKMEAKKGRIEREIAELRKKIEEIRAMDIMDYVKHRYTSIVYVDEEGYFAEPDPYDDDIFAWDYIVKEAPDFPKAYSDCETFTVTSPKTHRQYTYYSPCEKGLKYIAEHIDFEREKAEEIKNLEERVKELEEERDKIAKELSEAKSEYARAESSFKEATEKVNKFIEEHGLEELYGAIELNGEGEKIAEGYIDDMGISAVWYPEQKILSVFRQYSFDWWGTTLYGPKELAEKKFKEAVEKEIEKPSSYMIWKLLHGNPEEMDRVRRYIYENEELKNRAIENFKERMTSPELTEEEKKNPYSAKGFWERWYNTNKYGEVCDELGITEEVKKAAQEKIKKAESIIRAEEEERKRKEQEKFKAMAEKVRKLHPKLKLVSYDEWMGTVTVKIGRCDRDTFYEVVSLLKEKKGKFNYRTKLWTLKIKGVL